MCTAASGTDAGAAEPSSSGLVQLMILSQQLPSILKLPNIQPHIFRAIITYEWCQELKLISMHAMSLNAVNFILDFVINVHWRCCAVQPIVTPLL